MPKRAYVPPPDNALIKVTSYNTCLLDPKFSRMLGSLVRYIATYNTVPRPTVVFEGRDVGKFFAHVTRFPLDYTTDQRALLMSLPYVHLYSGYLLHRRPVHLSPEVRQRQRQTWKHLCREYGVEVDNSTFYAADREDLAARKMKKGTPS